MPKSDSVAKLAGKSLLLIYPNNDRVRAKLLIYAGRQHSDKWSLKVWNTWADLRGTDVALGASRVPGDQSKVWERYLDEQAISNIGPNDRDETADLVLFVSDDEKETEDSGKI